jgi:hypothetical protein
MRFRDDTPFYFKLPRSLKADFEHICRADRMTMTSTVNTFIRGFVEAKKHEDPKIYQRAQPHKWSFRATK